MLRPALSLQASNGTLTSRQLEALEAVAELGSMNSAADALGVKPPVLFRHLRAAEDAVGGKLVIGSAGGSTLTPLGAEVVSTYRTLCSRLRRPHSLVVACSPVTEELVMSSLPVVDPDMEMMVSHDRCNLSLLRKGLVDLVVVDDPLHLMEDNDHPAEEIGYLDMVHVDRGPRYVRHRYGAQRIAFRHLEGAGVPFTVEEELLSVNDLLESGRSFFVDEILLLRKGLRLRSSTDPRLLRHAVMAVRGCDDPRLDRLVRELRERMSR